MSRNRSRKVPSGKQKMRGPSRPVDPRRAPGRPARKGPDSFAIGLIGVSTALVLIIAILLLLNSRQNAPVASVPNQPAATVPGGQAVPPNATQTAVAFAADTANLPRITPQEARALVEANNATIIDVRPKESYATQHVKGANNIPYTDTQARLSEYPKTGNLIVYCQ